MQNFNYSIIEGHLAKDPELAHVGENVPLCKFTIGTNRSYTRRNGEKVNESHFFDVTAWSKLAENCHKYLKKGSRVLVSGLLKKSSWKTPDGEYRSRVYLESREVSFLQNRQRREATAFA